MHARESLDVRMGVGTIIVLNLELDALFDKMRFGFTVEGGAEGVGDEADVATAREMVVLGALEGAEAEGGHSVVAGGGYVTHGVDECAVEVEDGGFHGCGVAAGEWGGVGGGVVRIDDGWMVGWCGGWEWGLNVDNGKAGCGWVLRDRGGVG